MSVLELEAQIEQLRDTQRKYSNILRLARALTSHFYHVVQTQVSALLFQENIVNVNNVIVFFSML